LKKGKLSLFSLIKVTRKDYYTFVFRSWMECLVLNPELGKKISATPPESELSQVLSQFAKQNIFFARINF